MSDVQSVNATHAAAAIAPARGPNDIATAANNVAATRAAEASAQLDVGYARVKAPIRGRIGRRLVTQGNLVQGGGMMPGTLLAVLVSVDAVSALLATHFPQDGTQPDEDELPNRPHLL